MNDINTSILNRQLTQLRKEIAEQDAYRAFVLNANSVAPQTPRGYLLKNRNPLSSMVISTADAGKDVVELGKALVTGKSNDNQLGRFNDLGMKLGGLGIASYLFTRRGTGTKALMEFLGFGTFFGVMAAWPKVMISEPMKHRYGFDFRQKYVDSQGRKKYFFQDNQYQPWDMWSKEDLNKIGDKLNIPKDAHDREGLIKEKMRSIALQGNTLWMLSAGFSPLVTSMLCNLEEKAVTKAIVNNKYRKVLSDIDNLDKIVASKLEDKNFDMEGAKKLNSLLEGRTAEPDMAFFRNVAMQLDPYKFVRSSLRDSDESEVMREFSSVVPKIQANLIKTYETLKSGRQAPSAIKYKELTDILEKALNEGQIKNFQLHTEPARKVYLALIKALEKGEDAPETITFAEFNQTLEDVSKRIKGSDASIVKRFEGLARQLVKKSDENLDKNVLKEFYDSIEKIYGTQTRPIMARMEAVTGAINIPWGQTFESVNTSIHMDSVRAFMKELRPSMKDLKAVIESNDASQRYLVSTLGTIADNDNSYAEFISSLSKKQAQFDAKQFDRVLNKIKSYYNGTFEALFKETADDSIFGFLRDSMKRTVFDYIIEIDKKKEVKIGITEPFYKKVLDLFIEEKGAGIRATNHRYLLAADLEKRIKTGVLKEQWLDLGGSEDSFKRVLEMAREVVYNSTMNDLSNKFYMTGNGDEASKVISLIFNSPMDDSTVKHCDNVLIRALEKTRQNILNIYSETVDLARPGHTLPGGITAPQKTQYSMVGKSVNDLFFESAKKQFNDKRWMRMFGGLALAVVGITLISQRFFGRIKDENLYKKDNKTNQGGVNAAK